MKLHRLKAQLAYAERDGVLNEAMLFLKDLARHDWAHRNDFGGPPPEQLASNGPPRINRASRNVSISVRIVGGRVVEFGQTSLPPLEDCVGDLVVPALALVSQADRERLAKQEVSQILPPDTVLRCRLSGRHVPADLLGRCEFHRVPDSLMDSAFVELVLDGPLCLRQKGAKKARLDDVTCHVPALGNSAFASINEAYRRISEIFEPTRRSAGGNVFINAYYFNEERSAWRPLGELRGDVLFMPS